jgi:hypothetical protein
MTGRRKLTILNIAGNLKRNERSALSSLYAMQRAAAKAQSKPTESQVINF